MEVITIPASSDEPHVEYTPGTRTMTFADYSDPKNPRAFYGKYIGALETAATAEEPEEQFSLEFKLTYVSSGTQSAIFDFSMALANAYGDRGEENRLIILWVNDEENDPTVRDAGDLLGQSFEDNDNVDFQIR